MQRLYKIEEDAMDKTLKGFFFFHGFSVSAFHVMPPHRKARAVASSMASNGTGGCRQSTYGDNMQAPFGRDEDVANYGRRHAEELLAMADKIRPVQRQMAAKKGRHHQ